MEKWEYLAEHIPGTVQIVLIKFNELGSQGWELMFRDGNWYYFKRRKV